MKLIGLLPLLVLTQLSANCSGSKFESGTASQTTEAAATAPVPTLAFDETPLDISKLPENVDTLESGGPSTGTTSLIELPSDLNCENTTEKTIQVSPDEGADVKVASDARVVMNVKGRFCPAVSDNLTVVFIIDFSGSMGPNKPDDSNKTFQPASGNDPRVNNSCGRLQAAEAIMAKFKDGDKVNIGLVTFASDVVETHSIAPMAAAAFRTGKLAEANKVNNFCSYIAPDKSFAADPMAVQNPASGGSTNYAAAFTRAFDYLKTVPGRKAVYFITDGRPTAGGNDPIAAGKIAATKLKSIENLYFNAFFLQYKQSGLMEDKQGFDNLVATIGAPERVVRVDSAAQLAIEVGKEQAGSFDPTQIKASLTVEPYQPEADLKILNFAQDPANPKAWLFETQTFVLLGKDAKALPNVVKVSAKAKDGTTHSSLVKILYQKNAG